MRLIIALFMTPLFCASQVRVKINYIHQLTPLDDTLYLAGNINNWSENDSNYRFKRVGINQFELKINVNPGILEYKITRGSWARAEANANGNYISNRTFNYTGDSVTETIWIDGWEDIGGNESTTASWNTYVLDNDFFIPQLNRYRKIWVYLPPDYNTSNKEYPVVYMQDGQNLWDLQEAPFGEWEIDETMNALHAQGDYGCIVVGVDHGGQNRINEYSPWVNPSYGGGEAEHYADFLVNNLKPIIDSAFRVKTDPSHTGIIGSSMGGLFAHYAGVKYSNVFGRVGVFSPSFWFANDVFSQPNNEGISPDMKFYFIGGTGESSTMISHLNQMKNTLIDNGLDADRIVVAEHWDGAHTEWYWRREYPWAYLWLFNEPYYYSLLNPIPDNEPHLNKPRLYPNPSLGMIWISSGLMESWVVFDALGKQVKSAKQSHQINLNAFSKGIYTVKYVIDGKERVEKIIIN